MTNENETKGQSAEDLQKMQEVAKKNLEAKAIRGYFVSGVATQNPGEYGNLGKGIYPIAVSERPDETTWNALFAGRLAQGEPVYKDGLERDAYGVVMQSLAILPVQEVAKYIGIKGVDNATLLKDAEEKLAQRVIGTYVSNVVEDTLIKTLGERKSQRIKGLEEFLKPQQPEAQSE